MPVNTFFGRASLDTISFMPLNSADPFGGIIITDWYSTANNENEECKLNILLLEWNLKTQNLKVTSFCQLYTNQKWVNKETDIDNNIKLENAILNRPKN